MSDTVTGVGSECDSQDGLTLDNFNTQCSAAMNVTNVNPGVFGGTATFTIANTGSIDGSKLWVWAASTGGILSDGISGSVSSLPLVKLEGSVLSGDTIVVSYDGHSQQFVADADAAGGATAISVTTANATYPFPANSTVQDTSGNQAFTTSLSSGLTDGTLYTSLPVTATTFPLSDGDTVVTSSGPTSQTWTVDGNASTGVTAIPVVQQAANLSYPAASGVADVTRSNNDCYDTKTTTGGVTGATAGSDLNFNATAGNPLCRSLLIYIQETTGGKSYCWLGQGSAPEASSGFCVAPISVQPTGSISAGTAPATIAVGSVNGNVNSGDTLQITEGSKSDTLTATASRTFGDTDLAVSGTLANAYTSAAVIIDTTTKSAMDADTADTIANFDTGHNGTSGKIELHPVSADGTIDTAAPLELGKAGSGSDSRTFVVGVYLPASNGINQNSIQGLQSTFGITWHLDQ
jgi:hypothetical protein